MQAKAFTREFRALTLLTSALFLAGCFGEGDGPEPIANSPADPLPDLPADFCDPTNFEIFCEAPEIINFNGGATTIIENPDKSGINTSDNVAQMQKFMDEVFGGTKLTYSDPIDFSQGESFNIKVWSPRSVEVLFKTDESNIERFFTHTGGSEWQQFCVTFDGAAAGISNPSLTIIFDLGTQGQAASDPANWTFYYDDIEQVDSCAGSGGPPPAAFTTLTFDDAGTTYTLRGFGGAEDSSVVADPEDASNNVLQINRSDSADIFAGTVVSTGANESSGVIPLDASSTIMSMRVWSPMAGTPIRLKIENSGASAISVETETSTTMAMTWETLQFDFTNNVTDTPAFDPAATYDKVIVFPNFGATGAMAGAQTYYFDDIAVGPGGGGTPPPTGGGELLTNGDFEASATDKAPWINAGTVAVNNFYTADAADGGAVFDTNLSQVLDITQDENYVLTFRARATVDRNIVVGIGLSVDPFTAVTQDVAVTTDWQTFTLNLTATGFGGADSRVLFDLGTVASTVEIDDVSLTVDGGGGAELLTNGDFQTSATDKAPWINAGTIATNNFYTADAADGGMVFDTNLSQVLDITQDEDYVLEFRARATVDRNIVVGIGLSVDPFTAVTQDVAVTTDWRTFTLNLTATGFGGADSRVLFDLGTVASTVDIDDVSLTVDGATSGGGGGSPGDVDFESGSPMFNNFDGGMSAAVPNPDVGGLNTSAIVVEMQKFPGQPFGGSTYDLGGAVALAAGDSYTMLVRSPRPVRVTFKLEGLNIERAVWHSGSGTWEELCFDFTGEAGDVTGYTVIFDNGLQGAADTEPANWTFEYDDIQQTSSACPAIPAHDSGLLTNGDFESGVSPWLAGVTDPILAERIVNVGGNNVHFVDITSPDPMSAFAVNLSQKLAITPDETYTLTFKARSNTARAIIAGIGLSGGPSNTDFSNNSVPVDLNTGWQDFSLDLEATGFGDADSRVLFDLNGEAGEVYIDDVALVVTGGGGGGGGSTVLVNGDFEDNGGSLDGWTQGLFDDAGGTLGSIAADSSGQGGRTGTVARLIVDGTAASFNDAVISQEGLAAGTVTAGDTITVTFDLYGTVTQPGAAVFAEVIFLNSMGMDEGGRNFLNGDPTPLSPTTTWTQVTGTVTAGTGFVAPTGGGSWDVSGGLVLSLKVACATFDDCAQDVSFDNVTFTIN